MTEFINGFIDIIDGTMTRPTAFGWFHLVCIAEVILVAWLLCFFCGKADNKSVRCILLVYAIICLTFELYKQFYFTFDNGVEEAVFHWYTFPFQFCSIPMYAALIGGIAPAGRLRNAMISFIATYGLLGGILVMLIPDDVFTTTIGINIQTMVHHGLQTAVGFYLLYSGKARATWRGWLGGVCVFLSAVLLAVIFNEIMFPIIPEEDAFNMFFISPHYDTSLPVFSDIQDKIPHVVFVMLYTLPFTAATAGIHALRFCLPAAISTARERRHKPVSGKI